MKFEKFKGIALMALALLLIAVNATELIKYMGYKRELEQGIISVMTNEATGEMTFCSSLFCSSYQVDGKFHLVHQTDRKDFDDLYIPLGDKLK